MAYLHRIPWALVGVCLLLCLSGQAYAHGGGHRVDPPPPELPDEPPSPRPPVPTLPTPKTPKGPTPITPNPPQTTPKDRGRNGQSRGRGSGSATGGSWRIWWEYNREHLLGLRRRLRGSATLTGRATGRRPDPMAGRRDEVREQLRALAKPRTVDPKLRASALIALGRLSEPADCDLYLGILLESKEPENVQQAAALGLGLVPPLEDAAVRQKVREAIVEILDGKRTRPASVRGFLIVAAGLRARSDSVLAMNLARYGAGGSRSRSEAAALAYAFGATRNSILMPELIRAARRGELGGAKLSDIGRSHAAAGLALCGSSGAVPTLVTLLRSRRAGLEAQRGAALALGRLMRETELDKEQFTDAQRALRQVLDKGRDKNLVAFAAIALASATEPQAIEELIRLIDRSGNPIVKPYAALGLGLATERLDDKKKSRVRTFLAEELVKTKEIDLASALAVAVGLAGAQEAIPELVSRVNKSSLPASVRGAAAQALGLIGRPTPEIEAALTAALRDGPPELIEGAAMGLGLLGYRGIATELAQRLKSASSGVLQGKITIALGYLGQSTAVDPLLEILRDKRERRVIRELAAVALGLLGDPRDDDVLFELDAYFNFFATTPVTHELLTIF